MKTTEADMTNETLYMMAKRNVVAEKEEVNLSDIATIYCADQTITAKVKAIKVYQFKKDKEERCVISVLHVIEQIVRMCPGITIENLGETDVIVKYMKLQEKENKGATLKMTLVSIVCFIGTAFFNRAIAILVYKNRYPYPFVWGNSDNTCYNILIMF